ncbi:MAG: NERD domain-containing protein, partial [Verrucomicrobiota bacterium]
MDFVASKPLTTNKAELQVWRWLQDAFKDDEGVAYYRYPLFTAGSLRREPDFLMVHRQFGVWIFECKGFTNDQILSVRGSEWHLNILNRPTDQPIIQAEDQMYAVEGLLNRHSASRNRIAHHFRVVLPNIELKDWEKRRFPDHPSIGGYAWVREHLTPSAFRGEVERNGTGASRLDDANWKSVTAVIGGVIGPVEAKEDENDSHSDEAVAIPQAGELRTFVGKVGKEIRALDIEQQAAYMQRPEGPQRIRGLAGTGKTSLLARRAAIFHVEHPDWEIAVVFFTKSLFAQFRETIEVYHRQIHPENAPPDWTKLRVLHAWGGRIRHGFYSLVAHAAGQKHLTVDDAKRLLGGSRDPSAGLGVVCEHLLQTNAVIPQIFDAILIDEGQDLLPPVYQVALASLKPPKRLYWAYDEAQTLGIA